MAQKASSVLNLYHVVAHVQLPDASILEYDYKTYAYGADEVWQGVMQNAEQQSGFVINQHIQQVTDIEGAASDFVHTKQEPSNQDYDDEAPPWEPDVNIEADCVFDNTEVFKPFKRSDRATVALTFNVKEESK